MNYLVDTSIWSLALRRNSNFESNSEVSILRSLIADGRVEIIGAIRQEVLSGIRNSEQFIRLRDYLRAFPNLELMKADYEIAAEFYNICRSNGVQGSNTDFLICAVSHRRSYEIMTTDRDFVLFRKYIPIILWQ